jgi:hypothetical protein
MGTVIFNCRQVWMMIFSSIGSIVSAQCSLGSLGFILKMSPGIK